MGKNVSHEFQKGLERKRIERFPSIQNLSKKELSAAEDDLHEAVDRFKNKKYKYATIAAYYSMFHCARSLIYSKGYREKSHYYLLVAVRSLFVETGLLAEELIIEFHDAMVLREDADYNADFSKAGAETVIESAKEMLKRAGNILKK